MSKFLKCCFHKFSDVLKFVKKKKKKWIGKVHPMQANTHVYDAYHNSFDDL